MSLETRLRNTGQQGGVGGGGSGADTGGLVNVGSAGFLAYYPTATNAVSPSTISTTTGVGLAPLNFQALTTQIVSPNTGDFWVLNSAGLYLQFFINGTAFYTRLTQTDGSVSSSTAGLAGTGPFYVLTSGNSALPNSTAITGITKGYVNFGAQQAKLYASTSAARIDAGTPTWRLLFSPTTQQYGVWQFICPPDYGTNPYVQFVWSSDSSLSVAKSVNWLVDQWGMDDNQGRASSIYADTFGGTNSFTVALSAGYSSGTIMIDTIPLTTTVSLGANRFISIRFSSSAGNVTGNQELVGLNFGYTRA